MNKSLGKATRRILFSNIRRLKLHTNIDIDEGLTLAQEELIKTKRAKPSPQTFTCLLEQVSRLNNFTLNDEQFMQIKGSLLRSRY